MGILETVTVVLIVLKLVGVISWSWLAVFAPLMVGVTISIAAVVAYILFDRKGSL